MVTPIRCNNHNINAEKIEGLIWEEVEKLLTKPEIIISELERKKVEINQENLSEQEVCLVRQRLTELDREQQGLLQWALKGFPEETIIKENERINKQRVELKELLTELMGRLAVAKHHEIDIAGIEQFCELARQNLKNFSYEDKRLALEALQVKVWVNGDSISMTGAIPTATRSIVSPLPT